MSKEYKYTTKNLLNFKENYNYSTFSGEEFLNAFIQSRELYIKNIQNQEKNNLDSWLNDFLTPQIRKETTSYLLCTYIKKEENKEFVLKLHKKFEVFKRVYVSYNLIDMKPVTKDIEIVNFILLGLSLSKLYEENGFLGYLNSILKLNDIICSLPVSDNYPFSVPIEYLIKSEMSYIRDLK